MAIAVGGRTGRGPQVELTEFIPRKNHKICSVFPGEIHFHNHHGSYVLPGCPEGKRFTFVEVQPGYNKYDLGEDKHLVHLSIAAKTIAEDFIGVISGRTDYIDRGVFVPEGDEPTDQELAEAEGHLRKWLESKINEAEKVFAETGRMSWIDSNAKAAARRMGARFKWAEDFNAKQMIDCPACARPMPKGAKIHSIGEGGCGQRILYDANGAPQWAAEVKQTVPVPAPVQNVQPFRK